MVDVDDKLYSYFLLLERNYIETAALRPKIEANFL